MIEVCDCASISKGESIMNAVEVRATLESISSKCKSVDEIIHGIFVYSLHDHKDREMFLLLLTELSKKEYHAS
jgi:hypothetical protein